MPRRVPDYPDAYAPWNLVSSFGSIVSIVATLLFIYILFDLLSRENNTVSNNYWRVPAFFESSTMGSMTESASTLEWVTSSPPAFHTHTVIPVQS
jgi:heme/copper-type cytochrome/quinol oxidase subunit 1